MSVRYKGNTIIYKKGMTTQDCINVIEKRIKKRTEEIKIYEIFYKKYLSLEKKQKEDREWLMHLKSNPKFLEEN